MWSRKTCRNSVSKAIQPGYIKYINSLEYLICLMRAYSHTNEQYYVNQNQTKQSIVGKGAQVKHCSTAIMIISLKYLGRVALCHSRAHQGRRSRTRSRLSGSPVHMKSELHLPRCWPDLIDSHWKELSRVDTEFLKKKGRQLCPFTPREISLAH